MTTPTVHEIVPFRWNRDYSDLEQVAPYLPAFMARLQELEAAGQYRYNDAFKGHIPGIEGDREDTAIYLLQGLQRKRAQEAKVAALLADGYEWLDSLDRTTRFQRVILVPTPGRMQGEWAAFPGARVVPEDNDAQAKVTGRLHAVLPKGKRTHGEWISGRRVLVLR